MSASIALALITANFFLGWTFFFYISRMAQEVAVEVVTGVAMGVPISMKFRRIRLYEKWVSCALGAFGSAVYITIINVKIAEYATDVGIKPVAHMLAFFGAIGALGWLAFGLSQFLHHRSALLGTKRD
jgi:hypothetical protein